MKKSVQETLRLAVEQLFVRIHVDLISEIYSTEKEAVDVNFDEANPNHLNLVQLCKAKIGYKTLASNQEIFQSIMSTYRKWKEKERSLVRVERA